MSEHFSFKILYQSKKSKARVGQIITPHGIIDTPCFVPVGTNGTIKALDSVLVDMNHVQLMFCNTYHLLLQPGTELIKQAGGLHAFMNRKNPIITDSGGFQVFSLMYGTVHAELKSKGKKQETSSVLKINEEGVLFRSYRDGSSILLTPESSVQAQKDFGADIIIPLDELLPFHTHADALKASFDRTHRWQKRSLDQHLRNVLQQAMYGVVHGGLDKDLRLESCKILTEMPFDGFALGGSLGKTHQDLFNILEYTVPALPYNAPRHLLGIGDLTSVDPVIKAGIDSMDSSHPTRCARHGLLFTNKGTIKILNAQWKYVFQPFDDECLCYTCSHYTIAYVRHLFKAHELTAYYLATIHNIFFMMDLMNKKRQLILDGYL